MIGIKRLYIYVLNIALFALILQGCQQTLDDTTIIPQEDASANVTIAFSDSNVDDNSAFEGKEFYLCVKNSSSEIIYEWFSVEEVIESFRIATGEYTYFGTLGSKENLPSFDEAYYETSGSFTISREVDAVIPIEFKHADSYIAINFDQELFDIYYSIYYLEMYTEAGKVLTYDITHSGLFASFVAGELTLKLYLTENHNDANSTLTLDPITLGAGEKHTLNLTINAESGFNILNVTTDFGYEFSQEIDTELPGTILPFTAPKITAENFEKGGYITSTAGVVPSEEYTALVAAYAGVKSVIVRSTSAEIAELWGGLSEIDIVNATSDTQTLLKESGITWDGDIATPESAALCYSAFRISLGGLFENLVTEGEYPFEIEVVDIYEQSNLDREDELGIPFTFTYNATN